MGLFKRKTSPLQHLVGQEVTVEVEGHIAITRVVAVEDQHVELARRFSPGDAIVMIADPTDGVIRASGTFQEDGRFLAGEVHAHKQRRQGYRVATTCVVEVRRPANGDRIRCRTMDLSVVGVRLAACGGLRNGEKVKLMISLGDSYEKVLVGAEVMRTKPQPALRFVDKGEVEDQRLSRYVTELQRRSIAVAA
jgi:hypothetical protein